MPKKSLPKKNNPKDLIDQVASEIDEVTSGQVASGKLSSGRTEAADNATMSLSVDEAASDETELKTLMEGEGDIADPIEAELKSEHEAEAGIEDAHNPAEAQSHDEEAEKAMIVEQGADANTEEPAEETAMHIEEGYSSEAEDPENKETPSKLDRKKSKKTDKPAKKTEVKPESKKAKHSAKYQQAKSQVEPGKLYKLEEALELVKKVSLSKFDGSVELHLHLAKKKAKEGTQSARGVFNLPHGTGKQLNVIVLDEDKIEQIAKTKKIDFDVALATPALMPKVAKIARILGPKGKMPDPKSGTVTTDPEKTIEDINSGKVEYRIDDSSNIHQVIGKVSWEATKLIDNAKAVFSGFPKSRLTSSNLTPTIGPSIPLDLNSVSK